MDKLSSLPDSILGHILSFLPPKNAVATSILSTRWKSVFLHVHDIKLDDPQTISDKSKMSYMAYAIRQLMLASGLRSFTLHSTNLTERSLANLWVRSSLTRNIQELDVKVDSGLIPNEIFSCNPLVVIKIEGPAQLKVPKFVSLPNLKVMKLKHLTVSACTDPLWEFSVGYPQVEDLQLLEIKVEDIYRLRIYISTLQKLSVHDMEGLDEEGKTVINAPNLCYLELEVHYLIWEISSSNKRNTSPLFGKLKFLELRDAYGYGRFDKILDNAPNLERLVCNVCKYFYNAELKNHRLREVEIRNFGKISGFDSGLKMVLYLLKNGVLMERMTIVGPYGNGFKEVFESPAFKKLLLQASCSPAVQLLYCSSLIEDTDDSDRDVSDSDDSN